MLENLLQSLETFEITRSQVKIFILTFVAVSLMVVLQHLGIHSPIAILSLDK